MAEEAIVHHGAPIRASGLDEADEAFVAALVRGELGVDQGEDTPSQIKLRSRLTHAFSTDPEDLDAATYMLGIWDLEPDDEATRAMVRGWLDEIYGARAPFPSADAAEGPMQRWPGLSSASTC